MVLAARADGGLKKLRSVRSSCVREILAYFLVERSGSGRQGLSHLKVWCVIGAFLPGKFTGSQARGRCLSPLVVVQATPLSSAKSPTQKAVSICRDHHMQQPARTRFLSLPFFLFVYIQTCPFVFLTYRRLPHARLGDEPPRAERGRQALFLQTYLPSLSFSLTFTFHDIFRSSPPPPFAPSQLDPDPYFNRLFLM